MNWPDRDAAIAERREPHDWCDECKDGVAIVETHDWWGETAERHVIRLACGHEITWPIR